METQRDFVGKAILTDIQRSLAEPDGSVLCSARRDGLTIQPAGTGTVAVEGHGLYMRVDTSVFYPEDAPCWPLSPPAGAFTGLVILSGRPIQEENMVAVVAALTESHRAGRAWALIVKSNRPAEEFNAAISAACEQGQVSRRWWREVKKRSCFLWVEDVLNTDQMRALYNSADFLLKPVHRLSSGAAIAEATACGVPCIVGAQRLHDANPLLFRLPAAFNLSAEPSAVDIGEAVHRLECNARLRREASRLGPRYAGDVLGWGAAADALRSLIRLALWRQARRGSQDFFVT